MISIFLRAQLSNNPPAFGQIREDCLWKIFDGTRETHIMEVEFHQNADRRVGRWMGRCGLDSLGGGVLQEREGSIPRQARGCGVVCLRAVRLKEPVPRARVTIESHRAAGPL